MKLGRQDGLAIRRQVRTSLMNKRLYMLSIFPLCCSIYLEFSSSRSLYFFLQYIVSFSSKDSPFSPLDLPLPLLVFRILTRHRVWLSSGSRFGPSAWLAQLVSCVLRASPTSSLDGETDVKPSFLSFFLSSWGWAHRNWTITLSLSITASMC